MPKVKESFIATSNYFKYINYLWKFIKSLHHFLVEF